MTKLFLSLDDAVLVATRKFGIDPLLAEQEFEQKCYITERMKSERDGITKDKNIKNCENCGWWTCKDMNKRRCQYCYNQDEWIPDYDDNNGIYKKNITIKSDKHIKGYSNNYPLLCDLEVIFSNNKEWITLRDNRDNSITVEIKSLIKLLGYGKTIGDMIELVFGISLEDFKRTWGGGEITESIWDSKWQIQS